MQHFSFGCQCDLNCENQKLIKCEICYNLSVFPEGLCHVEELPMGWQVVLTAFIELISCGISIFRCSKNVRKTNRSENSPNMKLRLRQIYFFEIIAFLTRKINTLTLSSFPAESTNSCGTKSKRFYHVFKTLSHTEN